MRRIDREKDREFAIGVLNKCEYATLATVNPDNTPYCIPISYVLYNGDIYFHCAVDGKKIDNIKLNSNVCISCVGSTKLIPEQYSTEYESAVVMGKCTEITDTDNKIDALKALCEKYAPSNMVMFNSEIERSLSRTSVYRITIDYITGKAKQ